MMKYFGASYLKTYLILIITTFIVSFAATQLRQQFGLPENPTEADNLTSNQVLIGFILTIVSMISGVLGLIGKICFTIALILFFLHGSKRHTKSSKKSS